MKRILFMTMCGMLSLSAMADGAPVGDQFYDPGQRAFYQVKKEATSSTPGEVYLLNRPPVTGEWFLRLATKTSNGGYSYNVTGIAANAITNYPDLRDLIIPEAIFTVTRMAVHDNPKLNAVYLEGNNVDKLKNMDPKAFGEFNTINYLLLDPKCADEVLENALLRMYFREFNYITYGKVTLRNVDYVFAHSDGNTICMNGDAVSTSAGNTEVKIVEKFIYNSTAHSVAGFTENFNQNAKNNAYLKSVVLDIPNCPDGLFTDCTGITKVTITNNCNRVGRDVFSGCTNLATLDMSDATSFQMISDNAFSGCTSLTQLDMPKSFVSFAEKSFKDCTGLQTVNAEGLGSFTTIHHQAFRGCTNLTTFNCANSPRLNFIGDYAFANCTKLSKFDFQTLPKLGLIGAYAFYQCEALKGALSIKSNEFTVLDKNAFDGTSITSVDLPASLTEIGNMAFAQCMNLHQAVFRGPVVGDFTFLNSTNLERVYLYGNVTSLANGPFMNCAKLKLVMMNNEVPPTISGAAPFATDRSGMTLMIPNYKALMAYSTAECYKDFGLIRTDSEEHDGLYFGAQIEKQGEPEAYFDQIGDLSYDDTDLVIPANVLLENKYNLPVTVVSENATWDHYWFKTLSLPESIRYIGDKAFRYQDFETVEIPAAVAYIGSEAFANNEHLKLVRSKVKTNIGGFAQHDAFLNSPTASATLEVPSGTASIYNSALPWKYFGKIFAVNFDGIEGVDADATDADSRWYNLQGVEVRRDNLTPGIYINGGKKVIVK